MQKHFSLILASAVLVLLAICLVQSFQLSDQKGQITGLQSTVNTNAVQIKKLQKTIIRLESERLVYNNEIRSLTEQNSNLAAQHRKGTGKATTADTTDESSSKSSTGNMLANMLKDPEMKKAMEAQQKQIVGMMYGPLFKQLNLSPEETDRLRELLLGQQMKNLDVAGGFSTGDRSKVAQQMKTSRDEMDGKIKDLLGDDRFMQYQDYTTTIPDRMILNQYSTMSPDSPLSDVQQKQLLQIMGEERKTSNAIDFSNSEKLTELADPEKFDQFLAQQQALNEHVFARAGSVLTPEQLQSFGAFQTNMLEMQQAGLKMAQKMWGAGTNAAIK